jgi:hypothetical protein
MFNPMLHKKEKSCDDWNTPKSAIDAIIHLIPKGSGVYEPFTNDTSKSHIYIHEHGFKTRSHIGEFYTDLPEFDFIVSNPPFSEIKKVLSRLFEIGKPFIIIAPLSILVRQYFADFRDKLSILIPAKRIHFEKEGSAERSPFDCIYLTNLPIDRLTYLKN